jgi:hypothetical protein
MNLHLPDLETQMAEAEAERPDWVQRLPFWVQGLVMLAVAGGVAVFSLGLIWMTIRRW